MLKRGGLRALPRPAHCPGVTIKSGREERAPNFDMTGGHQRQKPAAGAGREPARRRGTDASQAEEDDVDKITPVEVPVGQRSGPGLRGVSSTLRHFRDLRPKGRPSASATKGMTPKKPPIAEKAEKSKRTTPVISTARKAKKPKVAEPEDEEEEESRGRTPRLPTISPVRARSGGTPEAGAPANVMALGQSHEALLQMSRLSNVRRRRSKCRDQKRFNLFLD